MPKMILPDCFQDGPDFYSEAAGHVWSAPRGTVQHDFDMDGARIARMLFLQEMALKGNRVNFQ